MGRDMPDHTRFIAVNVDIPEIDVGPVNCAVHVTTPTPVSEGARTGLLVDSYGRLYVVVVPSEPSPLVHNPKKYEGTVATAGSPVTLDVNTDLGKNAGDGYIACDGDGNLEIDLSYNGVDFEEDITIKDGEALSLQGLNIDTIKIDATANNTAYRVLVI